CRPRGRLPGPRGGVSWEKGRGARGHGVLLVLSDEEHDDRGGWNHRDGRPPGRGDVSSPPLTRGAGEVRPRARRLQLSDDRGRRRDRARPAAKARRVRAQATGERGPPHEGDLADRGPPSARRRERDAPLARYATRPGS